MAEAYDDAALIEDEYLQDLEGLCRLVKDRHEAGYSRSERLEDFIIMGHWATDSCGNFGRCEFTIDHKPTDIGERLPKVLASRDLLGDRDRGPLIRGLSMTTYHDTHFSVPRTHIVCPVCKKCWTLENAHDVYVTREDRVVPLTVGKSIRERQKDFASDPEGVFGFGPEPSVRNPKFVDLSPHPEYKTQTVNEKGWRYHYPPFDHERLTQDYVAEEGDECSITVWLFHHKRCWELEKARRERADFVDIFARADLPPVTLSAIPNEYCKCEACGPWFVASFVFGDIKIGWRKRVINIDWSGTGRDLSKLFDGEDVTRGSSYIHAWGADKAVDYLKRLRGALA